MLNLSKFAALSCSTLLAPIAWAETAATNVADRIDSGTYYFLENVNTRTYMDLAGGQTSNGVQILGWHLNPTANQMWRFDLKQTDPDGTNWFNIINFMGGTAVDLSYGSSSPNTPVQCWAVSPYTGAQASQQNTNQLWRIEFVNDVNAPGYYRLYNKASGTSLDLTSAQEGKQLTGNPKSTSTSQLWFFIQAERPAKTF